MEVIVVVSKSIFKSGFNFAKNEILKSDNLGKTLEHLERYAKSNNDEFDRGVASYLRDYNA